MAAVTASPPRRSDTSTTSTGRLLPGPDDGLWNSCGQSAPARVHATSWRQLHRRSEHRTGLGMGRIGLDDWDRGPMNLVAAQRDGISFFVHKATEGRLGGPRNYPDALERARARRNSRARHVSLPVAQQHRGAGGLLDGLRRCEQTPWWKDVPWIWQIDAEGSDKTPPPSADEVARAVAAVRDRLARQGNVGYVIAYAPFSKYGDSLPPGFDIWNANYNGSGAARPFRQQYEGVADTAPAWNVRSGRKPRILQFADDGYVGPQSRCDVNKFDGTLHDLVRLCGRDPQLSGAPPLVASRERIAIGIDRSLVPSTRFSTRHPRKESMCHSTLLNNGNCSSFFAISRR